MGLLKRGRDPWHLIGTAGQPAWQNGWLNYGGGYECGFRKLSNGLVVFRGLATAGVIGQAAFTLPTGYRPVNNAYFASQTHNGAAFEFAAVEIHSSGVVYITDGPNTQVSLWGCSFVTEG